MAWRQTNRNPMGKQVGDCVIRAIATATGKPWHDVYADLTLQGYLMCDMPSANAVWGAYLKLLGFQRHIIPTVCPDCYNLQSFCDDHPHGVYLAAFGTHVAAVIDGDYYDTWDSGEEIPIYYFAKEE